MIARLSCSSSGDRRQQGYHTSSSLTTFFIVFALTWSGFLIQPVDAIWTWLAKVNAFIPCYLSLFFANLDPDDFDRYEEFYRDTTVTRLAETGEFVGIEEVREYNKAGSFQGPYFLTPLEINQLEFDFQSYDKETKMCMFLGRSIVKQTSDATNTAGQVTFESPTLIKIGYNLEDGYVQQQDLYLGEDFWNVALRGLQDSAPTRAFICDAMVSLCTDVLPPGATDDCPDKLATLPFTTMTGDDGIFRFDQNSVACRAVHAALVATNPVLHCPHLSFEAAVDPNGKTKCQDNSSKELVHLDLFTAEELQDFNEYLAENGFTEGGTNFVLP